MGFSVAEVLQWTGGRLVNSDTLGEVANKIRVSRPAPLGESNSQDLSFFFSKDYQRELMTAKPGILITGEPFVGPLSAAGLPFWASTAVIACPDPYFAMAVLSQKFAGEISSVAHVSGASEAAVHPTAVVHSTVKLGANVRVGPHCVIEQGAVIGSGTVIYSGCFIGPAVEIGKDCVLFANVSLYEWTKLGDRVRLHSGVVLGSDGFGYAPRIQNKQIMGHQKIYHLGRVIVGDDVEIGANSCVDRSTFGETRIGNGSKLDNLVHIGHNAVLGEGTIVCGGTCFAGRASTGRFVTIGGLSGVANQVHVGDFANVGALSLVTKDVPPSGTAVGNPQRDYKEHFRAHAVLNRLMAERSDRKRDKKA